MPVATISPNVGIAKGPRCRKGIIDESESDSFESIHDTASALGAMERDRAIADLIATRRVHLGADGTRLGTTVEDRPEKQPDRQSDPLRVREVTREGGD